MFYGSSEGFQSQPQALVNTVALHATDLRGRHDWNWSTEHASWIAEWDSRRERIIQLSNDPTGTSTDYLPWYQGITRRYIGRTGAMYGHMVSYLFTPTKIDFSFFSYYNIGFYDLLQSDFIGRLPTTPYADIISEAPDIAMMAHQFRAVTLDNSQAPNVAGDNSDDSPPPEPVQRRRPRPRAHEQGRGRG